MIETVYKNRDNPNVITFKEDGIEIDFSAATRMVMSFSGSTITADSDVDSSLFDWLLGSGQVEFNLNGIGISGTVSATLIVYDAGHTNGQVLVRSIDVEMAIPRDARTFLNLEFVDV